MCVHVRIIRVFNKQFYFSKGKSDVFVFPFRQRAPYIHCGPCAMQGICYMTLRK